MNSLVSVIIPTWNRKEDLEKAIKSVLNQSYTKFEILVCDDGSNDGSAELVQHLMTLDNRVQWISSRGMRGGCPAIPRNRGILLARGEWIAFLDSDDTWLPQKIEVQLKKAEEVKAFALCTNSFLNNTTETYFHRESLFLTIDSLLNSNKIICSSVLINRGLLEKVSAFPENLNFKAFEDYACWLRVSLISPFYYDNTPLLHYTLESKNSVRNHHWLNNFLKKIRVLFYFYRFSIRNSKKVFFHKIMYEFFISLKESVG